MGLNNVRPVLMAILVLDEMAFYTSHRAGRDISML
jgi:hypothetical protein